MKKILEKIKYKFILDSSSNLNESYIKENYKDNEFILNNTSLSIAPLKVIIGDKEYVDDESLDVKGMLNDLNEYKGSDNPKSSCPSVDSFLKPMDEGEIVVVVTISSKLSGSYKNAVVAKNTYLEEHNIEEKDAKILVLDSKLVCGTLELILIKALELIDENHDITYKELETELIKYRDSMNLLFVLNKFDNLVKNGRMNKVVAFIAMLANIKPLCYGEDGEIKIKEKIRTINGALKRLAFNIGKMCEDTINKICIISYTECKETAEELKKLIESLYKFKEIKLVPHRGLTGFYSLEGGIICCF